VLSLLLLWGVAPLPCLVGLWAIYLSLVVAGQVFLGFQWDALLLETGLCASFCAPLSLRPRWPWNEPRASRAGLWLVRLLLFKLMVLSGATKLLSGDAAWWQLTALEHHYYTQPLPVWTSWYAHHLPAGFQRLSVATLFVIELVVPFVLFCGRWPRRAAACALAALQLLIAATGNYGFFNLLTLVLCVAALDDEALVALLPRRASKAIRWRSERGLGPWPHVRAALKSAPSSIIEPPRAPASPARP
jgi:uncharacterized membrane protein YphA (DoxX/SURF4 family)